MSGDAPRQTPGSVSVIALGVEGVKYPEAASTWGTSSALRPLVPRRRCHLSGADPSNPSWGFLRPPRVNPRPAGLQRQGQVSTSISAPALLRGLGLRKEYKRFMQT